MIDEAAGGVGEVAERVREFDRFFSDYVAVFHRGVTEAGYTATQFRVLRWLDRVGEVDASGLAAGLELDPGYLSRLVSRFVSEGLVARRRDVRDGRRHFLSLTDRGRSVYAEVDESVRRRAVESLSRVGPSALVEVTRAMAVIEGRLSSRRRSFQLREPFAGDLGRIVTRHAQVYAREYGWSSRYEALVATIVADYAAEGPSAKSRLWVADYGGDMVGSVMCVPDDEPSVAKLRVLLVEPYARGMGVGGALVSRCLSFAADAGYRRIRLWTVNRLTEAARLYRRFGFVVESETQTSMFGGELTAQTWSREL